VALSLERQRQTHIFKHDKQQDQEIQDLKDHIRSQQKEFEMLKQAAENSS
jgi:hypothetical protein